MAKITAKQKQQCSQTTPRSPKTATVLHRDRANRDQVRGNEVIRHSRKRAIPVESGSSADSDESEEETVIIPHKAKRNPQTEWIEEEHRRRSNIAERNTKKSAKKKKPNRVETERRLDSSSEEWSPYGLPPFRDVNGQLKAASVPWHVSATFSGWQRRRVKRLGEINSINTNSKPHLNFIKSQLLECNVLENCIEEATRRLYDLTGPPELASDVHEVYDDCSQALDSLLRIQRAATLMLKSGCDFEIACQFASGDDGENMFSASDLKRFDNLKKVSTQYIFSRSFRIGIHISKIF